jgi:hypothetical protein
MSDLRERLHDLASVVAECQGGAPGEPITLVAWGKATTATG